jgi:hypothetical protein
MAAKKLKIGDLVARVEAPTVLYRVTTRYPQFVRILPFRRSGKEHVIMPMGSNWVGDGSTWNKVGTS